MRVTGLRSEATLNRLSGIYVSSEDFILIDRGTIPTGYKPRTNMTWLLL